MIKIQPVTIGLNLGEATKMKITVDYELLSQEVTLNCFAFNEQNVPLNVSPIKLDVPAQKLQEWDLDFGQVIEWACAQLGVERVP
jgi:hypothetical protein